MGMKQKKFLDKKKWQTQKTEIFENRQFDRIILKAVGFQVRYFKVKLYN